MKTKIIRINPKKIEVSKIKAVARILRNGGLVAFPTETVYGLGANAFDIKAVRKIFEAKGRPTDNPLIVHIADKKEVYSLAKKVPKEAEKLIDKFWPGPLTLVLKKSKIVPKIITAGLDSVAIRMPANEIALSLIKMAKISIAAPSANLSGKPSPTRAEHVISDLYGKIDSIINGGNTKIGVESTVLDLTTRTPLLLRPGGITLEELKKVLGKVEIHSSIKKKNVKRIVAKSPGMRYRHYAPIAKVILIEGKPRNIKNMVHKLTKRYKKYKKKFGIIKTSKHNNYKNGIIKFIGDDFNSMAKNLFKTFREFDKKRVEIIIVEGIDDKKLGFAIMNRLRKAAYKIIKI